MIREYPDISFVDTDTESIVNNLIQAYEFMTGRTLYPADPARIFILWVADIIVQQRVLIDTAAKQNVPRYAKGEYLDSLAELFFDVSRLQPGKARTTLRFYISTELPFDQLVPKGTRVTVDGEIIFETIEDLYIKSGSLYGDVIAECQTPGTIGNGFVPGQITEIIDVFPYYSSVENITESNGGSEREDDNEFYERMRSSMKSYSTAGPKGSYEYWAKTVSSAIADVKASSPKPGEVDVRILLENGELPSGEMIEAIEKALSDDKLRPLTDKVTVAAPDTVDFDIDVKFYIPRPSANSTAVIADDVEKAVDNYIKWQTEKMGRDINPSFLIAEIMKTGVKRVEVIKPAFKAVPDNAVAVLKNRNVVNGGVEDE